MQLKLTFINLDVFVIDWNQKLENMTYDVYARDVMVTSPRGTRRTCTGWLSGIKFITFSQICSVILNEMNFQSYFEHCIKFYDILIYEPLKKKKKKKKKWFKLKVQPNESEKSIL